MPNTPVKIFKSLLRSTPARQWTCQILGVLVR